MANISHFTQTVNGVSTTYDIHDANAVHLTNNQTIGGIKTFSNAPVVSSINLDGKSIDTDANGNMTYDGHIVDTVEEQGDGYIRYSGGIQICWGLGIYDEEQVVSYAKAFIEIPSIVASMKANPTNWHPAHFIMSDISGGSSYACWQAIGRWK